jgi:signal transduction histidine kinase
MACSVGLPPPRRLPLVILAVLSLGILVSGVLLHRSMAAGARRRGAAEIDAVAALKVAAVNAWRDDAERDAAYVASYPSMALLAAAARRGPDAHSLAHAERVFANLGARHGYELLALLRPDGEPVLERRAGPQRTAGYDPALLARAIESGPRAQSILVALPEEGSPRLDLAAAVVDGAGRPIGAVYLRLGAKAFVESVVGSWPVPSASAETVVVRPDGDAVLFVTEPRYLKGWALRTRIPVSDDRRGVVRAVREEGVAAAVDFRGTPMLIASRRIPGSDWTMVTRMDTAEMEAPVVGPASSIAALVVALLAGGAVALILSRRHELARHRALARAREELEESRERFRLALAGTHWVWDWDLRSGTLRADPQWAQSVGLPEPVVRGDVAAILAQIALPDDLPEVESRFEAHVRGEAPVFEAEFRTALPGWDRWVLVRGRASERDAEGRALRVTGVLSDVTQRRQLQAQLERSERMASLGTLAAGVAHEINNPLAYVLANLDELARELPRAAPARADLAESAEEAREGAERVRNVVRGLKSFSRGGSSRAPVDVAEELTAAVRLTSNEIRHRARLEVVVHPMPRVAAGDRELGQVFLNLLLNAAQAIPEGHAAENAITVEAGSDAAGWARVEIRDTGVGIPPQVLPRIFEPFFTTKPLGVGTGLGLAIAHGIVTVAGGRLEVESQVARGSTFRVLLPPAPESASSATAPAAEAAPPAAVPRYPRVMVVDDDPLVARSVARALGPTHEVVTVSSAADAVARLEQREPWDVLVCDLMMPEMTGMDLYEHVAAVDPALAGRFVFVTGGAFTPRARDFLDRTASPCVEKPFEPRHLREVVQRTARQAGA